MNTFKFYFFRGRPGVINIKPCMSNKHLSLPSMALPSSIKFTLTSSQGSPTRSDHTREIFHEMA